MIQNIYNISDEDFKGIVLGYTKTTVGLKKLSWFYEVELSIVKKIIKDLKKEK